MIKVDSDWWRDFFNEVYLITDARSVDDQELDSREVDFLEEILRLNKSDRILDLCGGHGRHSLELGRRGYKDLTVFDYSHYLLRFGKETAEERNLEITFHQGDARSTGLEDEDYDVIIAMGNSFGYFLQEEENLRILCEINRLLKAEGQVLLDLLDREFLFDNFCPVFWHEANDDIIVCRLRELDVDLVRAREIVLSKKRGLIQDRTYCERFYSEDKICQLLEKIGFKDIFVRKNFSPHDKKDDYGFMTSRMIVVGKKVK